VKLVRPDMSPMTRERMTISSFKSFIPGTTLVDQINANGDQVEVTENADGPMDIKLPVSPMTLRAIPHGRHE
jgi:hypothetical protein